MERFLHKSGVMLVMYTLLLLYGIGQVFGGYHSTEYNTNQSGQYDLCVKAYNMSSLETLSRYIDASGKPGSGIYGGNLLWFGSYSECKKIQSSRYCLAAFDGLYNFGYNKKKILLPLQWGACVPNACTKENLKEHLLYFLRNVSKIPITISSIAKESAVIDCPEKADYTTGVILTIIFCGVVIALCLLGTILEIMSNYVSSREHVETLKVSENLDMEKGTNEISPLLGNEDGSKISGNKSKVSLYDVLHCFSMIRNTNFVLNTNVGKNDLTYLHGIRVLSLFWIILLHTSGTINGGIALDNAKDVLYEIFQKLPAMVLVSGTFAVDTFFVLSGLLVVYVNLIKRDKNQGKINWFKFFFHRFWRLTPSYMVAILVVTKLRPFMGDGPWLSILQDTSSCDKNWWKNLLYINNFDFDTRKTCIAQTWYLSADMQFYTLSPIFILVFLRFGFRRFLALASVFIMGAVITTGILIGENDLSPVPRADKSKVTFQDFLHDVYTKPYCRIQAYIVGLIVGFIIFRNIGRKFHLKWYWVMSLWLLSIGTALSIVYAPYNTMKENPHVWSTGENVIYGSLTWTLWGMCIAWLIFACQYGYAGLVKSILAEKFWIPLSRINYAAFILHFDIIYIVIWNIETPIHYTRWTLVTLYLAILVLCYGASFIFTVVVELPFANLEGLLLDGRRK